VERAADIRDGVSRAMKEATAVNRQIADTATK
jgi:hypothetical protein